MLEVGVISNIARNGLDLEGKDTYLQELDEDGKDSELAIFFGLFGQ